MIKEDVFQEEIIRTFEQEDYEYENPPAMPSRNHGIIQSRLNIALGKKYEKEYEIIPQLDLAPPGVKPSLPDLCIYHKKEVDLLEDEIRVTEAPITAIEILSPMQGMEEIKNKIFKIYFPAGVKTAWLVVPTIRSVHIFTPDRKFVTFVSGSLHDPETGITLELDEFFP